MYNSIHGDFIATPVFNVLRDGIMASASLSMGAESFPMGEYFFQSLFLRMTGAQEQKMKCLYWELATNDFEYRYDLVRNKNYGECSSYKDKCGIYQDIISLIKHQDPGFSVHKIWDDVTLEAATLTAERRKWEAKVTNNRNEQVSDNIAKQEKKNGGSIPNSTKDKIRNGIMGKPLPEGDYEKHIDSVRKKSAVAKLIEMLNAVLVTSNIVLWKASDFDDFHINWKRFLKGEHVSVNDSSLLGNVLQKFYTDVVYTHRNRCAHNTTSYQKNLPSLSALAATGQRQQNYFYMFALLILIDEVFIRLYKYYLNSLVKLEVFE